MANEKKRIKDTLKERLIEVKSNTRRWHVELILLGFLLVPIFMLFNWVQGMTGSELDPMFIQRAALGIVVGVLGMAIWILGASFIVINLLRDILDELKSSNREENS